MTRTVLIVSYHFAPSPAVGAKRFGFLAREFARLGYDVHVITRADHDAWHGAADASLPVVGHIHRCREALQLPLAGAGRLRKLCNRILHRLLAPVGLEYFWARAATRCALEVARKLPRGVVIATTPPYAAALAGARIARALDWPLILDYRDPWSAYEWPRWRRGPLHQWIARRIETGLVRHSAGRILNTEAMRAWFEKSFPHLARDRNFVIPNGFDPVAPGAPVTDSGPIEILHAGAVFAGRSFVPVLTAIAALQARHPGRPLQLVNYGQLPQAEMQRIRAAGFESFLCVRPRVPFAELFANLQRARVLLAVVGDHMLYSTPYKVYDYMASGRPILGLAPEGAALHGLLAESGAGVSARPDDVSGLTQALERLLFDPTPLGAPARVERFRWSNLAHQYRSAIDTVSTTRAAHHPLVART